LPKKIVIVEWSKQSYCWYTNVLDFTCRVVGFDIGLILISMNLEIGIGTPAGALRVELIQIQYALINQHHLLAKAILMLHDQI
jgi:hypothetical protein